MLPAVLIRVAKSTVVISTLMPTAAHCAAITVAAFTKVLSPEFT